MNNLYQVIIIIVTLNVKSSNAFNSRIIGGTEGSIVEIPYQVSIHYGSGHICGGAIIATNLVVTAAHCLFKLRKDKISVIAGSTLASRGLGNKYLVRNFKIHEKYNEDQVDYDIALIRVVGVFKYGVTLQPIPVAYEPNYIPNGGVATVSGWGYTKEDGNIVTTLRRINVPLVDQHYCRILYQTVNPVTENMICAETAGRGACQGDSGGPLVYNGKLIGLVSWGYGCARPQYPGVYTHIAHFHNWIQKTRLVV